MNRLLGYLDRALDHLGRFLRRELEVPIYWKVLFFIQLPVQGVLFGISMATGSFNLTALAMIAGFGVMTVVFAQEPTKNRNKYCRSCGTRLIERLWATTFEEYKVKVCPQARPTMYDFVLARGAISCENVEHLPPLYHTPHDPNMPDIDCVPCLLQMERTGAIAGKEVDQRIKKLMAA